MEIFREASPWGPNNHSVSGPAGGLGFDEGQDQF